MTENEVNKNDYPDISSIRNLNIQNAFIVAKNKLEQSYAPVCSISGGADSDIMLDLIYRSDEEHKTKYVFLDTGLEFQATRKHLAELQDKYGIEIETLKAVKPIPTCVKKYGVPFLSKQVSENIMRLQTNGFQWEDDSFENLLLKYPHCKTALKWWCNLKGEGSSFNISRNKWLKEFLIENPPTFPISSKCCYYAKKLVIHNFEKQTEIDLSMTGVRKAEGGVRASAYKNCFTPPNEKTGVSYYRPLFWFTKEDKEQYEEQFNIVHSDCYKVWGMKRTGCCGCPYGRDFEQELALAQKYEPKMYKAMVSIFGEAYEYTRLYKQFVEKKDEEKKQNKE